MVMHASTCTWLIIHANMYVYRGTSVSRRGIYIRHIHIVVYSVAVEEGTRRTVSKHSVYTGGGGVALDSLVDAAE